MFSRLTGDQWLGLCFVIFALVLVFVWVPLDVETGILETVRRRITLGDGLAPTLAGVVILIGGVLTFVRPQIQSPTLTRAHLQWLAKLLFCITLSLIVMRYAGPLATGLTSDQPYRVLRATPPYNYIGYVSGGTVLIALLASMVRGKAGWSPVVVGLIASLLVAMLYDLPFDDLQLPPNGDV